MTGRPSEEHPFALDDGAYVLAALSPEERAAYEAHLRTCRSCTTSVSVLAGLPGLLGRVPADVVRTLGELTTGGTDPDRASAASTEASLDAVLTRLLDRAQRADRRRRGVRAAVLAGAAALVAAVVGLGVVVQQSADPETGPDAAAVETVELDPLRSGPMAVTARLSSVAWGTRIELTCTYESGGGRSSPYGSGSTYSLVVRDGQGHAEQVATWHAVPGRVVTVQAATALSRGSITELEVRSADGTPLLRTEG